VSSENPWLYEFEKLTPFVFILPNVIPIKDYPRFLGYLTQSRDFDAILIQGSHEGYRLLPTLRTTFPKLPILDYLHFVTPDWMQGGFPRLSLLYQDFIDFTFTSCEQVRDWMIESGASAERMEVVYIGVDPQLWKPDLTLREQVRAELGIPLNETVLLYAARLEEQKKPDVLADTLCKLMEKGDGFHALVAGEGSLMAKLKGKLLACGLQDRVHILGRLPTEKMPAIMAASDIFFLPSQNEGVSQALYEAMSSGLVVVSAQVGGQGELVTADCGFLLSPETPQDEATEYADILHTLIADSPRRQQMSQASRKRVIEKFTLDLMGICIHRNLCEIIEDKKSRLVKPVTEQEKQSINRETQTLVEYLQARQRVKWLNQEYSVLIQPKTPSHWFYLWLRQLLLPVYNWISRTKLLGLFTNLKQIIKNRLVKDS
jgi:glycosyltransferase involved in cell wall biosynthesis